MHPDLSFEQAPPVSVPFRFFLTAPWFGVAAGLLMAQMGETAIASRWSPAALALTHLLAVGFMLQAMAGALLQFVPVAAGGNIWRPQLVAGITHPIFVIASVSLVLGFLGSVHMLLQLAATLFVLACGIYGSVVGIALVRTSANSSTIRALRLAIIGMIVTVFLGGIAVETIVCQHGWPLTEIVNVHAAWGLGGWCLMLLVGVSYYVVPMFQLTPAYPRHLSGLIPLGLVAVLTIWTLQITGSNQPWQRLVLYAGLALAATFSFSTLWLQQHRRRRVSDPSMMFFRVSMVCLLGVPISELIIAVTPSLHDDPRNAYWLGVLMLPGVFVSAINGMLYKIVPFLCWLHLQRALGLGSLPPNMREILPERAMRVQMWLHFLAVALLLVSVVKPDISRIAGLLFAISSGLLGWNLIRAVNFYLNFRRRIPADGSCQAR